MATIFRKTDKGQAEVETRAHRLSPRLRSALILVDGKRSSDELRKLIAQQPDDTLAALNDQGFIEIAAVSAAPAPAAPAPAAGNESRAAASSSGGVARDFDGMRRQLVREFTELTGPLGEAMALRLEKAADRQALRSLLAAAGEYVIGVRGASAANDFVQRYADKLGS
jgi:hypothetical protein